MATTVASVLSANGGLGYLSIHAVQFGAQPLLSKACIAKGTPTSSLVLGAETAKALGCIAMLVAEGNWRDALRGWTLRGALLVAGIPSLTYLVQNYCIQIAYQNIDGVVFNILNQTKMLFTAVFSFLMMGRRQSRMQCVALFMVSLAGILISVSESRTVMSGTNGHNGNGHGRGQWALGIICILTASALSGLGSGITEWILQGQRRNSYVFSAEMAFFGCAMIAGSLVLNLTTDAQMWRQEGLFARWRWQTLIPVLTQGWGGIVVGLITKVAGGVKKGFAVISGLILTCLVKSLMYGEPLSLAICTAGPLVGGSIYLHAKYPPVKKVD
mmetsp:Transcript_138049/g.240082  ORF Transcript_138049/g.240082 Transcript_138049/m.240082 type:complete len:328 (-) Transcript_138049:375-1358(-)